MTKNSLNTDILIVGGGPAGLTFAKSCEQNRIDYVLIEKNESYSTYSKATGVHVNSMRILNEFNLSSKVVDSGVKLDKNIIIYKEKVIKEIIFTHGDLPHELNISISQEKLESIIVKSLKQSNILYNHRFQGWSEDKGIIRSKVYDGNLDITKLIKAKVMVAADGGKSIIRKELGLDFDGETSKELSFSFDAQILTSLEPNCMFTISNEHGRIIAVPIGNGIYKISGKLADANVILDTATLTKIVHERSGLVIEDSSIKGLTTYYTHSRIASQFKIGNNIFFIGDAAHVFYPSGGYGLNMAMKDAYILGNTLKEYFHSQDDRLLDSFASKRKSEARQVQKDAVTKRAITMDTIGTSLHKVVIENLTYNAHSMFP